MALETDHFDRMHRIFSTGTALSRTRANLESMRLEVGLPVNIPFATKKQALELRDFFTAAQSGFTLTLHESEVGNARALDLIKGFQTQRTFDSALFAEAQYVLYSAQSQSNIDTTSAQHDLAVYLTSLAVLLNLSGDVQVTFDQFLQPLKRGDLGTLEETPSFWPYQPTTDKIWDTLQELEQQTQMLLHFPHAIHPIDILPVSHFFIAGMNLNVE